MAVNLKELLARLLEKRRLAKRNTIAEVFIKKKTMFKLVDFRSKFFKIQLENESR